MVLTEAFAAGTPVIASDIPGYRDVVRDGLDGHAGARPATRSRSPRRCARSRSTRPARRAWPLTRASAPSASPGRTSPPRCSTATSRRSCASAARRRALGRVAVRYGLAPADLLPRIPAERLPSLAAPGAARPRRCARGPGAGAQRALRAAPWRPAAELPRSAARARAAGARANRRRAASPASCWPPSPGCWRPAWG